MHASVVNEVMCAEPGKCVQPGVFPVAIPRPSGGEPVILEFCQRHGERRAWLIDIRQWPTAWITRPVAQAPEKTFSRFRRPG